MRTMDDEADEDDEGHEAMRPRRTIAADEANEADKEACSGRRPCGIGR